MTDDKQVRKSAEQARPGLPKRHFCGKPVLPGQEKYRAAPGDRCFDLICGARAQEVIGES
jgi:hypothetical protein